MIPEGVYRRLSRLQIGFRRSLKKKNSFDNKECFVVCRLSVLPKSWYLQKRGGGGLTHAKIFWWICRCIPKTLLRHHSTQIMIIYPPKSEHLSPKIDHHQQLVNIYPKSNHSLPKMVIYALFTSKCRESHLRAFVVKSTRVPGLG